MTTAPDVAGQTLYYALTPRAQCHVTRTKRFDHLAAEAFDQGWTVGQLAERITSGDLGDNPGGVITSRLEWCAENDPPPRETGLGRVIPFCSPDCRDRGGWIEDAHGTITGRCPCRTTEGAHA